MSVAGRLRNSPRRCVLVNGRALRFVLPALALCQAIECGAAAVASSRHWRISIDAIECRAAESLVTLETKIRYLGPKGPVEAPLSQLIDAKGERYLPTSLVWRGGSKPLAQWLSAGGLSNLQSEVVGEFQWKFGVRGASGDLQLEFGDIQAFALTRKKGSVADAVCKGVLKPDQVRAPRVARAVRVADAKRRIRVYRSAYPCLLKPGTLRTTEAEYPPYAPRQLLFLGLGYLPNARQIELPMGRAAAQSYAYAGVDDLNAVEDAARRVVMADFPEYGAGLIALAPDGRLQSGKYFAFNWGSQRAHSGNEAYSIGIYDVSPCPK